MVQATTEALTPTPILTRTPDTTECECTCDTCCDSCENCNFCEVCDAGCDACCDSCDACDLCETCDGACDACCDTCEECDVCECEDYVEATDCSRCATPERPVWILSVKGGEAFPGGCNCTSFDQTYRLTWNPHTGLDWERPLAAFADDWGPYYTDDCVWSWQGTLPNGFDVEAFHIMRKARTGGPHSGKWIHIIGFRNATYFNDPPPCVDVGPLSADSGVWSYAQKIYDTAAEFPCLDGQVWIPWEVQHGGTFPNGDVNQGGYDYCRCNDATECAQGHIILILTPE